MPFIDELIKSIDGRIQALSSEIVSLEHARTALVTNGSESARAQRTSQRRTRRTSRRKSTKKTTRPNSSSVLLADQAERLLASTDGLTTAALAKEAGANRDQVLALLRDLEKAQRVRRSGQRRATRWHAITDEDRIQERAAELEARSRRRQS
jgi:hypothetical protein